METNGNELDDQHKSNKSIQVDSKSESMRTKFINQIKTETHESDQIKNSIQRAGLKWRTSRTHTPDREQWLSDSKVKTRTRSKTSVTVIARRRWRVETTEVVRRRIALEASGLEANCL